MISAKIAVDYTGIVGLVKIGKQRSITLKAVKAGGKIVASAAKTNAPKRKKSGALKQSLGVKSVKGTAGKTVAIAVVGARMKVVKSYKGKKIVPAFYSHIVDQGSQAHRVGKGSKIGRKGKLSKSKRKGRKGKIVGAVARGEQTGGQHPGAKATRFLERAWTQNKGRAGEATKAVMAAEIQKAIAKASSAQMAKAKSMQSSLNGRGR